MAKLEWYFHRLRAMGPEEVVLRLRKWLRERIDGRTHSRWGGGEELVERDYPDLPAREGMSADFLKLLTRDRDDILGGRWKAFGRVPIQVDDPPKWNRDYLAGVDVSAAGSAFRLNHRRLPEGADVKLIWELSRWQQLTRLALAADLLEDVEAADKCVEWLADWVRENPPFRGWNWTSALESGLRLIQFVWMDALLERAPGAAARRDEMTRLRSAILKPHVYYTWRHRSFGSSANNHLLGELAGLMVALARWPGLAVHCTSFDEVQGFWEREVVAQFSPDGGNREQALNYHLFSWELSLIAWSAVLAGDGVTSAQVEGRLSKAAEFYVSVQREQERWDYGDSDDATVLPFWRESSDAALEWRRWMANCRASPELAAWWNGLRRPGGIPRVIPAIEISLRGPRQREDDWCMLSNSGIAVKRSGDWFLRFDLSPLGYGSMAAHGHLDALHLSIWWRGKAVVIDPGTGAYYGDRELREWLASRAAHNGPCLTRFDFPKRCGPFLWSEPHAVPAWRQSESERLRAEWFLPAGTIHRSVVELEHRAGWEVVDDFLPHQPAVDGEFTVRWQFAPGAELTRIEERRFRLRRGKLVMMIEASKDWEAAVAEGADDDPEKDAAGERHSRAGEVSSCFRVVERAPALVLTARAGHKPCVFKTSFLACAAP